MTTPRAATSSEKLQLALFQMTLMFGGTIPISQNDVEQIAGDIDSASIAVFDGYMSDGPGYAGRVMVVVWSGGPSCVSTFTWDERGYLESVAIEGA